MRDKENQKNLARKHYLNHTATVKDRAVKFKRIARERNREYIDLFLSNHPCVDCGESDIVVLEFDHVKGAKIMAVVNAINRAWSISKLKKEIDKCEVRCANCHRRITNNRRKLKIAS